MSSDHGIQGHVLGPIFGRPNTQIRKFGARTPEELLKILGMSEAKTVDAWDVPFHFLTFRYRETSIPMLLRTRKPAIFGRMNFLANGAMAAYEPDASDSYDVLAAQCELVLQGVPIQQIPVVQSTRYRFGLNLTACRNAGVNPPKSLIKLADQVLA